MMQDLVAAVIFNYKRTKIQKKKKCKTNGRTTRIKQSCDINEGYIYTG